MILGYKDKWTELFAGGKRVKAFQGFARQAKRRLTMLHVAKSLNDLREFPGNRLEALRGNREEHYSIRINRQWRICFQWPNGEPGPSNVEIVDYH